MPQNAFEGTVEARTVTSEGLAIDIVRSLHVVQATIDMLNSEIEDKIRRKFILEDLKSKLSTQVEK